VDSERFGRDITRPPYPKYTWRTNQQGGRPIKPPQPTLQRKLPKGRRPEYFRPTIDPQISIHTPVKALTKGHCINCRVPITRSPLSNLTNLINREVSLPQASFQQTFRPTQQGLIEKRTLIIGRQQVRGRQTYWKCDICEKYICREGSCWEMVHLIV
jgi:hypothetical protein